MYICIYNVICLFLKQIPIHFARIILILEDFCGVRLKRVVSGIKPVVKVLAVSVLKLLE